MRWLKQLPTLFDRRRPRSDELVETRGIGQSAFTEGVLNQLPDKKIRDLIRRSNPIVAKALADYADSVASGFTYTADTLAR